MASNSTRNWMAGPARRRLKREGKHRLWHRLAFRPLRLQALERRYLLAGTVEEVGVNDFLVSDNPLHGVEKPAVAYDHTQNQYLAVWQGIASFQPDAYPMEEYEIFGRWIDGTTGDPLGPGFQVSRMGPDGDTSAAAFTPNLTYNHLENEFLVVWSGSQPSDDEPQDFEIYAQRIDAAKRSLVSEPVRLSDMGPENETTFDAEHPAVTFNGTDNEYLVVWQGNDGGGTMADREREIFGQRLGADAAEVGNNDFRISDMGPDGNIQYSASTPAVVHNSSENQYLVVWSGEDDVGTLVNEEDEIFGQLLDAAGTEIGTNDFRVSDMGPDQNVRYDARTPAVTYNTRDNQYLVTWSGVDGTDPVPAIEWEIHGQLLAADGTEYGNNDFQISDLGPNELTRAARDPAIVYNGTFNEFLVTWRADPETRFRYEIVGQVLAANGTEVGNDDFRISDSGFDADNLAVAANGVANEYLVVWADRHVSQTQAYGQRLGYLAGFDFNGRSDTTAPGYVGVATDDLYDSAVGYGWETGPDGDIERVGFNDLLFDAHFGMDSTFRIDLPDGGYTINVTFGDATAFDYVDVHANGVLVLNDLSAPAGEFLYRSFPVEVSGGSLDIRFVDGGGVGRFWTLAALEILSGTIRSHTLSHAAGNTFAGSGGTPGSLITVTTDIGVVASSDSSHHYAGVQVQADSGGNFTFDVVPPGLGGTVIVRTEEVTGLAAGEISHEFENVVLDRLHVDFIAPGGTTAAGYVGVSTSDTYDWRLGYGWTEPPADALHDATVADALLADGVMDDYAVFHVSVPDGEYIVNITQGREYSSGEVAELYVTANGDHAMTDLYPWPPPGLWHGRFSTDVVGGLLDLEFLNLDEHAGDWRIVAMDIFPGPAGGHTLTASSDDTITGSGATPEAFITVSTDVGTVTTPDAHPDYVGRQVRADASGNFSFEVAPAGAGGTVSIHTEEVTGAGSGELVHAFPARPVRFDFNTPTSATASGYVGVQREDDFDPRLGYGWTGRPSDAHHDATIADVLLADGHMDDDATFRVSVPDGPYVVNITQGGSAEMPLVDIFVNYEYLASDLYLAPSEGLWHGGYLVDVVGGRLDLLLTSASLAGRWRIVALDVFPAPAGVHTLTHSGDGTFTGSSATADALVTVSADPGLVVSADADPYYAGVQVRADASGNFTVDVEPVGRGGIVTIQTEEVTGLAAGEISHDFESVVLDELHLDFDAPGGTTAGGYVSLTPADVYDWRLGYGWTTPPTDTFLDSAVTHERLADSHSGFDATLLASLADGEYVVNLTQAYTDSVWHSTLDVYANGDQVMDDWYPSSNPSQSLHRSFPVTVVDGRLELQFVAEAGMYGWRIPSLEVFPGPAAVHTLTPSSGDTMNGSGATPESVITVSTDVGSVVSADADPDYCGVQVVADASGNFTFQVQPPGAGGTVEVRTEEVTGAAAGLLVHAFAARPIHFDFNTRSSPTAGGFVGVGPGQLYYASLGYGWEFPPDGSSESTIPDEMLRDGHAITYDTFVVTAPAARYVVNLTLSQATLSLFSFMPLNVYANERWVAACVSSYATAGEMGIDHCSFELDTGGGRLDLRLADDGGGMTGWGVHGLELFPAPAGEHILTHSGDGTFTGSGATPESLITVRTDLGRVTTADADPHYADVQVRADASGNFTFDVEPPGRGGTLNAQTEEVTGLAAGEISHEFESVVLDELHLDFDAPGGTTASGYVSLTPADVYDWRLGYGWTTPPTDTFLDPIVTNERLADSHSGFDATLLASLADGEYVVNLTQAYTDSVWHSTLDVYANGDQVMDDWYPASNPSQSLHRSFPVTVVDGRLELQFVAEAGMYGWRIPSLEVFPGPAAVHTLTPSSGDTINGSGATPESVITVSTDVGSVVSADADPDYYGVQVLADASGNFTFQVQPPGAGGTVEVRTEEVSGAAGGDVAHDFTSTVADGLRLDFNTDWSPTADGYVGIASDHVYDPAVGYGWRTPAAVADFSTADDLRRDMHYDADNTFQVDVENGVYFVNITLAHVCTEATLDLYANEALILDDIRVPADSYLEHRFPVTVTDERLALHLLSDWCSCGNWAVSALEVDPAADDDGDGVLSYMEDAAPHAGDGNRDGIPDREQPHVASLPDVVTDNYVTLVTEDDSRFRDVVAIPNPSPHDVPEFFDAEVGFFDFVVTDLAPNGAATVTLFFTGYHALNVFYEYGPTHDHVAPHWYKFMFDGSTGAEIQADRIVLHFVDGMRGDGDLAADGVITDTFAAGSNLHPFPWRNLDAASDVNNDGHISPVDVLAVINELNVAGAHELPVPPARPFVPPPYFDVNGDGFVSPMDALVTINDLNEHGARPVGEGESAVPGISDLRSFPPGVSRLDEYLRSDLSGSTGHPLLDEEELETTLDKIAEDVSRELSG